MNSGRSRSSLVHHGIEVPSFFFFQINHRDWPSLFSKKQSQFGHRVPLIDLPLSSGVRRRGQREIERYFAAAAAAASKKYKKEKIN